MTQFRKPELMSPAGYWPELRAAIESGADAVYFGLNHFSARAKVGFTLTELPEVVKTLHRRSVKGFVTFNTLVFDQELALAEKTIGQIADAGVDAIIVQDVGVARMARAIAPELDIHGSTQMSITSAQGAELAKSFGCSRVVLGRELSLTDIAKIASQTDVELEVFVHGALCVSYSGQCFSSEAWGGRSANRGKCAQACRLSYDLIVDGQQKELGEFRYLLSPGDLYAIEQIPELVKIGVSCLKIEGRYKDAEYVALTTQAYRKAIDAAAMQVQLAELDQTHDQLEQIYSRGLGPHFMAGVNHQTVVQGRAPRHRGLLVGKVISVRQDHVLVSTQRTISPGDGLVFDAANWRSPDEPEEGGNVYEVSGDSDHATLRFAHGEIAFDRIRAGDWIWRTNDPKLKKSLKKIVTAEKPVFTRPLRFKISAHVERPLKVSAFLESGEQAKFVSESAVAEARSQSTDGSRITEQLGRLGGTPFHLEKVELDVDSKAFIPASLLNEARRSLVSDLLERQEQPNHCPLARASFLQQIANSKPASTVSEQTLPAQIHLLVRTPEQLEAAIECRPASITLDYLELYGLRPSIEKVQAAGLVARVASPRILKPSEQNIVRFLMSLNCEILVRSGGLLHDLTAQFDELPNLIGDFSLNTANEIAMKTYLDLGLKRITPTYDLNASQIEALAARVNAEHLEVIVYSHLPVFHTEHCVFCRFLSEGTDHTNCGHPCEKHRLAVRDNQGREHPVMADVGCRNTIFGAEAQTDPGSINSWRTAGIRHFRLEFVHQTAEQIKAITASFADFFSDQIDANKLARELRTQSPQSTTKGSLFVPDNVSNLIQLG